MIASSPHRLCHRSALVPPSQTARSAVERSTLCSSSTARRASAWRTSPWRRTLLSTPSTGWAPWPATPRRPAVQTHSLTFFFFSCVFSADTLSCNVGGEERGWWLPGRERLIVLNSELILLKPQLQRHKYLDSSLNYSQCSLSTVPVKTLTLALPQWCQRSLNLTPRQNIRHVFAVLNSDVCF